MVAVGLVILAGACVAELAYYSTLLATMIYLGYGFARVLSMALDGMPDPPLLQVAAAEIIVGLLCLVVFLKCRDQHGQSR